MKREPSEVWAARVQQWRESGLSARAYAAQTGVSFHTLTHWKYKLTARARAAAKPRVEGPGFVEVVLPQRRAPAAASAGTSVAMESFEVVLRGGLTVRVPPHFEASALRALVAALEAP